MEEAAWLTCNDPNAMLEVVSTRATNRKLRLFVVAFARLVWDTIPDEEGRTVLLEAERHADGLTGSERLHAYHSQWYRFWLPDQTTPEEQEWFRSPENLTVVHVLRLMTYPASWLRKLHQHSTWTESVASLHHFVPPLFREIFGNPTQPVTIDSSWLTWQSGTIPKLAQTIYEDRLPSGQFDATRLAILADALEECGCCDKVILEHLRGPGPHVRGCFVIDAILGKS
jgi:hypothetical protein